MGRKIFVSYKHSDSHVKHLPDTGVTTARHYVDLLTQRIEEEDHIYKGEDDGEDLSSFKDETIQSHLRDKIFDSSITIVLISKNMKNLYEAEDDQWIPWEISYSLKEIQRGERTSTTNAMLAVVLPDELGSYSYAVEEKSCVRIWQTETFFKILRNNMFNRKEKHLSRCNVCGETHHIGKDHSYVYPIKWEDFISDINGVFDRVVEIRENKENYNIQKVVSL